MNTPLTSWQLTEHIGLSWPKQVITHPLRHLDIPNNAPLCVRDSTGHIQTAQRVDDHLFYIADLPAHTQRQFDLEIGQGNTPPLCVQSENDALKLTHSNFGLCISWADQPVQYDKPRALTHCPPPIVQMRKTDGVWFGRGAWQGDAHCHKFRCERIYEGPIAIAVQQVYELSDGDLSFVYHLDAASPTAQIDITGTHKDLFAIWQFDDFAPTHAFWRPHSTDQWRGKKTAEDHHRQVYEIRHTDPPDDLFLQPFYNWNRNGAMFWSCWHNTHEEHNALLIGAVHPAKTHSKGPFFPHRIRNGSQLDIAIPNGQTTLTIGKQTYTECPTKPERSKSIESLYRQIHGLDLNAYIQMDMNWNTMETIRFPHLLIDPEEQDAIRETAQNWDWFHEVFQDHVHDRLFFSNTQPDLKIQPNHKPLGCDFAGAYLASGNTTYAQQAFESLNNQLTHWIQALGALGPTVDALIGFAFAGPFRAAIITFDLIANALNNQDRLACLQKIAFLTEVFFSKNAWPDPDAGLSRGNLNFQASVISARGLAAALLTGHPKQATWLSQTQTEAAAFLHQYHFDSGCARESLTYQFNVVAQVTLLSIALHRAGYKTLFETEPMLKQSFVFLSSVQTPPDPRVGFCMLPTVGHVTSYGWGQSLQACFAWAAKATAQTDPKFSAHMMAAWSRAGSPAISLHDFYHGQIWWPPLCLIDRTLKQSSNTPKSSLHNEMGTLFRAPKTNGYLLVKMGPSRGHYDPDEGSLLCYAYGKPILADFGCQYNPNIECAWLHNRISFDHQNETSDHAFKAQLHPVGPHANRVSGTMTITKLHRWADRPIRTTNFDFRALPPPQAITPITWQRNVIYVPECEAILIHDHITGNQATDWNLQAFANTAQVDGNHVTCQGQFGVDLDVYMKSPEEAQWAIGSFEHLGFDEPRLPAWWWRGAHWTAPKGTTYGPVGERALSLQIPAAKRSTYLALLIARPSNHPSATVTYLPNGFTWHKNNKQWTAHLIQENWSISKE